MSIRRAAVLGAGVMGSGIAAQLANAGVPVLLLDMVPPGGASRSALALAALDRLAKAEPAAFMHPRFARLVSPGNLEDDLGRLAGCDWVIEAIVEDLEVKRALYRTIGPHLGGGCILSSNTSTLPLAALAEGLPEALRRRFLVTHFFNPPRYMRLMELVASPDSDAAVVAAITDFADRGLGKTVVACKDTPGFIANRIGGFWLQCALTEAFGMGVAVDDADAALAPFGIPKTGVFGLLDLVGLDLMPKVAASLEARLPRDDPFHAVARLPELVGRLIGDGYIGRKGKGGFYRLRAAGDARIKEAIDLESGEYREARRPAREPGGAKPGLEALLAAKEPAARFALCVMGRTLAYAASLLPEIADDAAAVDVAMRLGYGWRHGPFELIDRIGAGRFAALLQAEGTPVPPLLAGLGEGAFYRIEEGRLEALGADGRHHPMARSEGVLLLADVKRQGPPVLKAKGASLWDLGDAVLCFEIHSKMNALDPEILGFLERAIELVAERHRGLVLHNEGDNFSVGVNLGVVLFAANLAAWRMLDDALAAGQRVFAKLRHAPFPVVGAPSGMALGGGLELLLHCDAVVTHAETYAGLPEVGVGLIPAWGGCTRMLERWLAHEARPNGPMPALGKVFEQIGMAAVARSAHEAKDMLYLRPGDPIVMNRDRLLALAKAKALELAADYRPPEPPTFALPGATARVAFDLAVEGLRAQGKASAYDGVVAGHLAQVLSGGDADVTEPVGEGHVLALERRAARALLREERTLARMAYMLDSGRPLRN